MSGATLKKSTPTGEKEQAGQEVPQRSLQKVASTGLLMALIFTLTTMTASFSRRSVGTSSYCSSNLRAISSAIELYARDNGAQYPPMLSYLSPVYMNTFPQCPSIGIDTYSCGYVRRQGGYHLCCVGKNHPELLEDMPAYDSKGGLITKTNPGYKGPDDEKNSDTATAVILLGVLSVVSYLTYRKK